MTPLPIPNELNHKPFLQFRKFFSTLPAVDPHSLNGQYHAMFTGPAWLRTIAPTSLALLHFKGWCGKQFTAGGERGLNLFNRESLTQKVPFYTSLEASLLDHQTSLVVHYSPGCPFPWGYVIDELRRLDETFILGMTLLKLKRFPKIAFPFLLFPWENDHAI